MGPGIHPSSLRSRHRDRIRCASGLLDSTFVRGNGEEAGEAAGASGLDADLSQVKGRREGRRQAEQAHFELQSGFKEVWRGPWGAL